MHAPAGHLMGGDYSGDRERTIVGTDKGDILVVENGDVRGSLTLDPAGPCAIAAIVATPKVQSTPAHLQPTLAAAHGWSLSVRSCSGCRGCPGSCGPFC